MALFKKPFRNTAVGQALRVSDPGLVGSYLRFQGVMDKYKKAPTNAVPTQGTAFEGPEYNQNTPPPINNQKNNTKESSVTTTQKTNPPVQTTNNLKGVDSANSAYLDDLLARARAAVANKTTPEPKKEDKVEEVKDPLEAEKKLIDEDAKKSVDDANDILENSKALAKGTAQLLIQQIQTKFAKRIEQMKGTNELLYSTAKQAGYRSGRARYAGIMQGAILTGEEQAGLERINELEMEEQSLIMQAEQARDQADFESLQLYIGQIEKIGDQKTEQLKNLYTRVNEAEKMALEKIKEERLAMKDDIDISTKLSQSMAPAFAAQLSKFKTDEDKMAFAKGIADEYGISNPAVLLGEMEEYSTKSKKDSADLANVYSLIANRGKDDEEDFDTGEFGGDKKTTSASGKASGESYSLEMTKTRAKRLERAGLTNAELVSLQTNLNNGYTLDEILAEAGEMPSSAVKLLKKYIKKNKK